MRLIEDSSGKILEQIFMPSNFGERGGHVPGMNRLISAYPRDQEKDFALLAEMNPLQNER
jgi:hypothetical protein